MQINKEELKHLKKKIIKSDDPHSGPFRQFLRDLPRMNEHVESMRHLSDSEIGEISYDASWALSTVNTALRQHASRMKDENIKDSVERLIQMAYALLIEVNLRAYPRTSYKKESIALGWSFIRDKTIAEALLYNQPQLIWYEESGNRASCFPVREMKEFTVVPYELSVVVGVVKKGVDEKLREWFREQDRVDCEEFLYGSEEFGRKWAEEREYIAAEKEFNEVVSSIISKLYEENKPVRLIDLGIGNGSSIRRLFEALRKQESKEKYKEILNSVEVIGVDKFRTMSKYSFETAKNLGINDYELIECDMVDFKLKDKDLATLYLLSANTRNNLDEEKRGGVDKNIIQNLKVCDMYIRNEYYPPIGKEMETALSYAKFLPAHACLNRAIDNGALALVIQYNPNHPEGGNVEFFSVYRNKPVYRIHWRSVRRNIDTIKKDGPLLGCNIDIHVDPEEHMVTSVLSK